MNMEEVEFSQSYVQSKSDRRQLIRQKISESIGNHRQIVPGGSVKDHKLINLPLTHLIYNADNVRIRDRVLTQFEIENTDDEKFDLKFYSKRENFETQKFIHSMLLDLAEDAKANILKLLSETKNQRDPILIDTDGVVVDGNRRLASIRYLYQKSPSDYPDFRELECAVIPEASRETNKEYEHQIHFASSFQSEYTWLNKALEAQRLEANDKDKNEIRRQLQLSTLAKVEKLLLTAKGMQQYNKLKKGFDSNHIDNNYVDLGKYGNEQSFIEIGKVLEKDIHVSEIKEQTLLQSIVHFVVSKDPSSLRGRAFNLNQSNKSQKLFGWYKKAIGVRNDDRAKESLKEFGKCQDWDRLKTTVQEMDNYRLNEEKDEREENEQSKSLSRTLESLDQLEKVVIHSGTTRKAHLKRIAKGLNQVNNEVSRIYKEIEDKGPELH